MQNPNEGMKLIDLENNYYDIGWDIDLEWCQARVHPVTLDWGT